MLLQERSRLFVRHGTNGSEDFLFTGDAEREAEASMLSQSIVPMPDVEILKVGHHGSSTSSSETFLNMARPEVAVYMAGINNQYGHPDGGTIDRLLAVGATVYGTDRNGTVTVTTNGSTREIQTTIPAPPITRPDGPSPPPGSVQITRIFYDGLVPDVESDEYVEITNRGAEAQNLDGWKLKDVSDGSPYFTFSSYILNAGATIRVYTNEIHPEWGGFSFRYGRAIWQNDPPHDVAALYDAQGREVSRLSY